MVVYREVYYQFSTGMIFYDLSCVRMSCNCCNINIVYYSFKFVSKGLLRGSYGALLFAYDYPDSCILT